MQPISGNRQTYERQPGPSRASISTVRLSLDDLPERFKAGEDAQVDVTAPPRVIGSRDSHLNYLQQSVFSMIAAVGSRSDFHAQFDESSGSDGETDGHTRTRSSSPRLPVRLSQSAARSEYKRQNASDGRGRRRQRSIPASDVLRPAPWRDTKPTRREVLVPHTEPSTRDESLGVTPSGRPRSATPRAAPLLSRMVEAQARFDGPARLVQQTVGDAASEDSNQPSLSPLAVRLKEMFDFEAPERVLAEYACSLVQSMLLPGYMYVTEGHVCFYAYLPRRSTVAIRSGYLHKRGRKNPKYNRYWFSLKGDVLSYYADPSNLYFPRGHVDLRYGISASLTDRDERMAEAREFQIITDQGTFLFRADSATSAKEWVKALQKIIFRTHNEGESVKVSFPIRNIIDIEESPMIDFAEMFKIRVVESGETYAIDEYFFSLFDSNQGAFDFLKSLINDEPTQSPFQQLYLDSNNNVSSGKSQYSLRRIRSASTSQLSMRHEPLDVSSSARHHDSSDSFVNSLDQATESSAVLMADTAESASEILSRSDVFTSPMLQQQLPRAASTGRRHSDDTAHSVPPPTGSGVNASGDSMRSIRAMDKSQAIFRVMPEPGQGAEAYSSTAALNEFVKAGVYPLQRAAGFAGYLRSRSKHMSNLLASESMGYIEKVSGMWTGSRRHYGEAEGILPDDEPADPEDKEEGCRYGDRFRAHFALPATEKLQATYYAHLHRVLPLYGKIYIGQTKICFRSLLPGTRTKMILPLRDVENVEKEKGFRFGYHGLVIIIRGHEELFFEFNASDSRDDCAVTLHQNLESVRFMVESGILAGNAQGETEAARAEHRMLEEARVSGDGEGDMIPVRESPEIHQIFDDPRASIVSFKPTEPLRITCLTIGSRGDVQPYIALCRGLLKDGHKPRIATHSEFEPWIRQSGIDFAPVEGDPAELMRICVENGMFTYSFLKEASSKFRGWIDDLLSSAWTSCQDSDLLIESPSAMAGIHIAEALKIPYFRGFTMPWTRTRAYPHAFAVPEHRMGGAYNYITYVMFDTVFWKAIAGQVNRWRKNELGLKATTLDKMQPNKAPFLYNYSPSVVPPPLDYPDWIHVTGYWVLDEGAKWNPPNELVNFIQQARVDKKKIVYIGFGSIVVSDPSALTKTVIESVQKADVRCILSKGWSDRLGSPVSVKLEVPIPPEIFQIQAAPHDWLFPQIDAAVHHGGAGTTGASLRAGVPTVVKPFFGDQFFFGSRVEDLGVGICLRKLNVSVFSRALWEATRSERMVVKARDLGARIRSEDGVGTAIQAIYRDLEYAKTLVQQRSILSSTPFSPTSSGDGAEDTAEQGAGDMGDTDEWTFIEGEIEATEPKRTRGPGSSDAGGLDD